MVIKIAKRANTYNFFTVEMKEVTAGKLLAIQNALATYKEESPVAGDVHASFSRAMTDCKELVDHLKSN